MENNYIKYYNLPIGMDVHSGVNSSDYYPSSTSDTHYSSTPMSYSEQYCDYYGCNSGNNYGSSSRYSSAAEYYTSAPPPPPPLSASRPQKRKLYSSLPKKEFVPQLEVDGKLSIFQGRDPSYPDDLNRLIMPKSCELCKTDMNSMRSAKDHYESKVHDRNITAWLKKNYEDKGLEPPEVKRFLKQEVSGPGSFYCDLCDLKLTSLTHAKQHYEGRKHRLVATNVSKPSGAGYYNNEGQWIRTGTKVMPVTDSRFGIGEDFKQPKKKPVKKENAKPESKDASVKDESMYCKICNVEVTSSNQMAMHVEGSKHRKKLVLGVDAPKPAVSNVSAKVNTPSKIMYPNVDSTLDSIDLTMYTTPSGTYYCESCNMSLNHVVALKQHLIGKKHKKKLPGSDKS